MTNMTMEQAKKKLIDFQHTFRAAQKMEEVIKVAEEAHNEIAALIVTRDKLRAEIHELRQWRDNKRKWMDDVAALRLEEHEIRTRIRTFKRELEELKAKFEATFGPPQEQE